jgi:hypothetical protein
MGREIADAFLTQYVEAREMLRKGSLSSRSEVIPRPVVRKRLARLSRNRCGIRRIESAFALRFLERKVDGEMRGEIGAWMV